MTDLERIANAMVALVALHTVITAPGVPYTIAAIDDAAQAEAHRRYLEWLSQYLAAAAAAGYLDPEPCICKPEHRPTDSICRYQPPTP
jgi:hypothetical protein